MTGAAGRTGQRTRGAGLGARRRGTIAAILLVWAGGVVATGLPSPTVDYQGMLRFETGRLAVAGPVHVSGAKERRTLALVGARVPAKEMIMRPDLGVVWVADPTSRSYYLARLPADQRGAGGLLSASLEEKMLLGRETVDGFATSHYRVRFAETAEGQLTGEIWVTAENIVLRLEGSVRKDGRSTPLRMTLSELRIGPQPADAFEPPSGFRLVPASHPTMGVFAQPDP